MKLILELEGGPPWGFRAAKRNSDEAVFVSQVVTGGKACQAGIKIGDVLENVQDLNRRPTFEEFQHILADANCIHMQLSRINMEDEEQDRLNDILNVPFIDENEEPKVAVLINQTVSVSKVETNNNSISKSLEHFQHPPSFPTSIFPGVQAQLAAENGEFRSNQPYSGGFCGTARDKRRFFELAAAQQIEKPPPPLPHRPQQPPKGLLGSQTFSTSQISMASDSCEQPQQQSMQTEQQLDPTPQLADFVNSFALE
uniref:PDZ domain-containing protein n=1 Tax=Ditylenchus dipsaci TaxID=166011 RepID=A0A915D0J7_9BILA